MFGLPKLEQIDHRGKLWRLVEDFTVCDPTGQRHTIKAGLVTDLASVPWLLTCFLGRAECTYASTPHDEWCGTLTTYAGRAWADTFFLYLLEVYGVPRWKRMGAYILLRCYALLGFWKNDIGAYREDRIRQVKNGDIR